MEDLIPNFGSLISDTTAQVNALAGTNLQPEKVLEQTTGYAVDWTLNIVFAVLVLMGGWAAAAWFSSFIYRSLKRTKMEETYANFLSSIAKYAAIILSVLWALTFFGLNMTGLVAVLGAVGLAIGLSLKDFLTHIAAGVMLMITRPFKVGDYVQTGEHMGTVRRITLFNTEINTLFNQRLFVPNGKLWDDVMTNHTYNSNRQLEVKVGVSYDDNMRDVIDCIAKTLKKHTLILDDPAPFIGVEELGDSAIIYLVRCWFRKENYGKVRYSILLDIKEALDNAGFEIPYPHFVEYRKYGNPAEDQGLLASYKEQLDRLAAQKSASKRQAAKSTQEATKGTQKAAKGTGKAASTPKKAKAATKKAPKRATRKKATTHGRAHNHDHDE